MYTWLKIIVGVTVLAAVYLWPVWLFLGLMMLDAPGNKWNVIAHVLFASLLAQLPLARLATRRLRYAGSSAQQSEKLRAVAPFLLNMMLSVGVVVYLAVVCSWKFACGA